MVHTFNIDQTDIKILKNEPLSHFTFTKTGGNADLLAFPKSVDQVRSLLEMAKENQLPVTFIGNASNLIVRDGGIRGLVIILTDLNNIFVENDQIIAQAGARIIDTSEMAYQAGLTGLEFAAGIPGSVGGAVFMNAGAYGGEVANSITAIQVIDMYGDLQIITGKDLDFGYRHSYVQDHPGVVIGATFSLEKGDKPLIREKMDDFNHRRAEKQPLEYPSCGSVFKRPAGHYTGQLIQEAGLQGKQIGGAQISKKHAGFIVNIDHATATDYLDLIHLVQKVVYEKFDVKLEPEVRIIGEEKN